MGDAPSVGADRGRRARDGRGAGAAVPVSAAEPVAGRRDPAPGPDVAADDVRITPTGPSNAPTPSRRRPPAQPDWRWMSPAAGREHADQQAGSTCRGDEPEAHGATVPPSRAGAASDSAIPVDDHVLGIGPIDQDRHVRAGHGTRGGRRLGNDAHVVERRRSAPAPGVTLSMNWMSLSPPTAMPRSLRHDDRGPAWLVPTARIPASCCR